MPIGTTIIKGKVVSVDELPLQPVTEDVQTTLENKDEGNDSTIV